MIVRVEEGFGYTYKIAYPNDFNEREKYPVLFFHHGAGERGEDISLMDVHGPCKEIKKGREFPCIVVSAQVKAGQTWFDKFESLQALIRSLVDKPYVDKSRVYLSGISMGGFASWQLLMTMPNVFAAAVICCGGGMAWNAYEIKDIPIWAIHGALDNTVPAERSIEMVKEINTLGGNAKLTIMADKAHDCWTDTFSDDTVYAWLFAQKKGETG